MILMVRMMLGMPQGMAFRRKMMMLFGMQFVTVSLLGVVRFGLMVVFVMGLVGLTVMMRGGFQMMGGFFVMVVLRHFSPPGRF